MGIIIISFIIFIVGFVTFIISTKKGNGILITIGVLASIAGFISTVSFGTVAISTISTKNSRSEAMARREVIAYAIENQDSNILISPEEISNFNEKIDYANKYHGNFFLEAFSYQDYYNLEKISYKTKSAE